MIYELREYVAHENAVEQLHARFADHTLSLFAEHGIEPLGFWTDRDDPARIVYLLRFDDAAAQRRAWAAFQDDPRWQQVKKASEKDGPIVADMLSRTLEPVSYWSAP
ncbi:hypothetical protein PSU4_52490 [Pseudonocardia sulfidoxydans NBRC 16205]|uniref:NIPSNAP domain-containing protein n=1 Tax=Pseudonocardia sulfidoxydans NBRC 16205 TaxID=1223511 RepID=A0A511DND1_9PSEU|nr:NIPSNAP family protein [Pseudonocardia sulfidoxydans]GEL26295.1 hypothetical protein PSU4_52490 [Pseudonocardia sulfidoxydans NBRC 16205]